MFRVRCIRGIFLVWIERFLPQELLFGLRRWRAELVFGDRCPEGWASGCAQV